MLFEKYVQIGRVLYIANGEDQGKLAVIVNIIDANKVLIDGPSTGVKRGVRNFKDLHLTKFVIPIKVGLKSSLIKKMFDAQNISEKFSKTKWAQKIAKKAIRSKLTDFERFKVFRVKQLQRQAISIELAKLNGKSKTIKKK